MLILTRRIGETLIIEPAPGLDPSTTIAELFAGGPITVALLGIHGHQSRIGIGASDALTVRRAELQPWTEEVVQL